MSTNRDRNPNERDEQQMRKGIYTKALSKDTK